MIHASGRRAVTDGWFTMQRWSGESLESFPAISYFNSYLRWRREGWEPIILSVSLLSVSGWHSETVQPAQNRWLPPPPLHLAQSQLTQGSHRSRKQAADHGFNQGSLLLHFSSVYFEHTSDTKQNEKMSERVCELIESHPSSESYYQTTNQWSPSSALCRLKVFRHSFVLVNIALVPIPDHSTI